MPATGARTGFFLLHDGHVEQFFRLFDDVAGMDVHHPEVAVARRADLILVRRIGHHRAPGAAVLGRGDLDELAEDFRVKHEATMDSPASLAGDMLTSRNWCGLPDVSTKLISSPTEQPSNQTGSGSRLGSPYLARN